MTIKSSVIHFCKAIEKERLKERSVYLLDRIITMTTHKLAKIRITYNRYERKKNTRYGRREDHYLYTEYIKTSKTCMELKKELLSAYELLYQFKEDVLRTDELGQLHSERYVEFISAAKLLKVIMEKIEETFGGWFISYSLRMKRIYNRFDYHLNTLSQLLVNDGHEVYSAFRVPDENVNDANENENRNLKKTMKAKMKSMRYSGKSSPDAIPLTIATRKINQEYVPMALYYKNSPLQGSVVPIPKNKEYLEKILSHFLEFTRHFDALGKRLKTAKQMYSRTNTKKIFSRRDKTFTGSPSSIRETTIQTILLRMGEFKKLVQQTQMEVKELDIDEKTFVQQLEFIEKGQPKRGYLELKRIVEHLLNETKAGNVGYEITMDMKARWIEHSEALDRALKKDLEKEYVDKHFPKITFSLEHKNQS